MRIGLVTKEWPPHIYGGAGVHALQLTQALRESITVDVHCFGQERADATGYPLPENFTGLNPALQAFVTDIEISQKLGEVDLVHSHTWYANLAGHFAALLHGIPHVITAHSLEPDRPWKAEQLGGGYRLSSWAEKTAYEAADAIIAVSNGMKIDILKAYPALNPAKIHTILNGVDTEKYSPRTDQGVLDRIGVTGRYALFVGRITRQKGLAHLLRAWSSVDPEIGLVIAAGSPDEPAIGAEISALIAQLQSERKNVWWQESMLPQPELNALLTSADLFICPSVYEPLGIVNLEAMACQTAVLASRVGGIPEVVTHGVTGELVEYNGEGPAFETALAESIQKLMANPELLAAYGSAGRKRAVEEFGWPAIADQTRELYQSIISNYKK
ncbi:MAG: glycogen synthase [Actinomycetes bacterium]|jgi:starch synthase